MLIEKSVYVKDQERCGKEGMIQSREGEVVDEK